jgi:hypothetical protein
MNITEKIDMYINEQGIPLTSHMVLSLQSFITEVLRKNKKFSYGDGIAAVKPNVDWDDLVNKKVMNRDLIKDSSAEGYYYSISGEGQTLINKEFGNVKTLYARAQAALKGRDNLALGDYAEFIPK